VDYSQIIGLNHLKNHLQTSAAHGRVPHAQLFSGPTGSGLLPLALAYAKTLLCADLALGSSRYQRAAQQVDSLVHPDLHFMYPVNTTEVVKKSPTVLDFLPQWRSFVQSTAYGSLMSWYSHIGLAGKQGSISVSDTEQMARSLALKSYEGGYKVMIIWMADKMNTESSNKILKLLEEPPEKTVFILLTEEEDKILKTIYSRCQLLSLPLLSQNDLAQALIVNHKLEESQAYSIAKTAHGDYFKAQQLIDAQGEEPLFEQLFLQWARGAFKAKGNKKSIQELLSWSDHMAGLGRETQKSFLSYCSGLIRQAFLTHYKATPLVYYKEYNSDFQLSKLAPFIHQNNIWQLQSALEEAEEHIERNGSAKIIFTDLAVQLTRLLHQSAV
jgi:DNA polymerase-3 subunit delta'